MGPQPIFEHKTCKFIIRKAEILQETFRIDVSDQNKKKIYKNPINESKDIKVECKKPRKQSNKRSYSP